MFPFPSLILKYTLLLGNKRQNLKAQISDSINCLDKFMQTTLLQLVIFGTLIWNILEEICGYFLFAESQIQKSLSFSILTTFWHIWYMYICKLSHRKWKLKAEVSPMYFILTFCPKCYLNWKLLGDKLTSELIKFLTKEELKQKLSTDLIKVYGSVCLFRLRKGKIQVSNSIWKSTL